MDGEESWPDKRSLLCIGFDWQGKISSSWHRHGRRRARKRKDADEGVGVSVSEVDIPFELVGEVASAGAVAEAGHVESGAAARHCRVAKNVLLEVIKGRETDAAVPRVCW